MLLQNRYLIIQGLASGGFGDTYLAEDTQMPSNRRCVIKQLKPINQDPTVYQLVKDRFQKEAELLEKLGQGNRQIPQLFGYFEEQGQFYLVQEWIEGNTLADLVQKQGRLSEITVKDILIKILPVLDFIENQHIIHRDIKPDNIILRQSDSLPVLIDFGAVKETMGTVLASSGNSTSSIVIGTPGFMPSEQMAGRPVYSSDLYALGLTAIYMLTGKIPQELPTDPMTGEVTWVDQATNISPEFASVLSRSIQTHPRDRFTTAGVMLNVLMGNIPSVTPTQISTPPISPTIPISPPPSPTTPSGQNTVIVNPPPFPTPPPNYPSNPNSDNWKLPVTIGLICAILIGVFGYYQYDQQQKFEAKMAQIEQERKEKEEQQQKEKEEAEARAEIARQEAEAAKAQQAQAEAQAQAAQAEAQAAAQARAEAEARANQPQPPAPSSSGLYYRDACGDPPGSGSKWYAVVGSANVNTVRNYCGDAFVRDDGNVQVASFSSYSRAENFANQLSSATGGSFWVK